MVIHLRPYQRLALSHLRRSLEAGTWRQNLDLPTGTGKSTLAAAFAAQRLGQTQGRVLALVHRQDLARGQLDLPDPDLLVLEQDPRSLLAVPSAHRVAAPGAWVARPYDTPGCYRIVTFPRGTVGTLHRRG